MPEPRIDDEAVPQGFHFERNPAPGDDAFGPRSGSVTSRRKSVCAKLINPLAGLSKHEIFRDVETFCHEKGLDEHVEVFKKGALAAQVQNRENGFEHIKELSEDERDTLRYEVAHKWHQPFQLYFLTVLCAGSAIVQGMDQTAVNGAQLWVTIVFHLDLFSADLTLIYYFEEFNVTDVWLQGLLNGAPYLCSVLIGCWTSAPLNKFFGRRGTIFISCFLAVVTGVWQAVADSWWNLLIARFALGLAVGAKSSTTPVYAAECAPKAIRGALCMQWQMWTAFGIMLGFIASVAFYDVTTPSIPYPNWRLMLGSTSIPPLIVMCQVYFCPESPRWYMEKGRYDKAWKSFIRLRTSHLQAARDFYYAYCLLKIEAEQKQNRGNVLREMFLVKRNRRAAQSAFFVMFMQQFCGVNVIAYYSSAIFVESGFTRKNALLVSLGTGIINWLFAIPAIYTIDTFGRRNLLLTTFPLMSICLFFTGFSFWIPDDISVARLACVALGIYLFMVVYSPGEGPVPFTYSAEAFPLYIRDTGMGFATATTWGFNFIISFTFPGLIEAFKPQGAFAWYACWNLFGWVFAYFFLPETKDLTLEELDSVFGFKSRSHAAYYAEKLPWYLKRYVLRKDVEPFPPLYESGSGEKQH